MQKKLKTITVVTDMNNLKEKYKQHLAVLNYSTGTIAVSIFYLNRFFNYLKSNSIGDITDINKDTFQLV